MTKPRIFERFIAIDWSGAGTDSDSVDLAIAQALRTGEGDWKFAIEYPEGARRTRWKRHEARGYLRELLRADQPRTLVAVDAGFSYPYGTAAALIDDDRLDDASDKSWRALVRHLADLYAEHKTARTVATEINRPADQPGPFRFNDNRNDSRFYTRNNVAYFRQVELFAPQVISTFYMGSGAAVGFHTITFLATLDALMKVREDKGLDFVVWLHEEFDADKAHHLLVECYPSLFDQQRAYLEARQPHLDAHKRDAMACVRWLVVTQREGRLDDYLTPRKSPVGRRTDCTWREQLEFERWILGVEWPE